MSAELELLEGLLARALADPDPAAALERARAREDLPEATRAQLAAIDPEGFVLSSLLVVKLRFERAVQGSPVAAGWFERDPAGFAAAFRRYHAEVAPTASLPSGEARLFEGWAEDSGLP